MSAMRSAIGLSLLFVLLLTSAGIYLDEVIEREIRQDIDDDLEFLADTLQEELDDFETVDQLETLWLEIDQLSFDATLAIKLDDGSILGPVRREVFRRSGFRTIREDSLFVPDYLRAVFFEFWELDEDLSPQDRDDFFADSRNDANWRVLVEDFDGGEIAVFMPIDGVEDAIEVIPVLLVPVGVLLVIAALFVGAILGALQQKRMQRINAALERISNGVLDQPINPRRNRDDIDEIMQQIDQTAERLNVSIRQMRDFSHNVAHELRTPLTKLRVALDDQHDDQSQERAIAQADALIHIFDALQRIARLKQKPGKDILKPVDLHAIVGLIDDLYSDVAEDDGFSLVVSTEHTPKVLGDQQLLVQAVANLVENAIRHAGPNAEIHVETTPDGLRVWDTGRGISNEDLARVLEPFQHGQVSAGTGLGLALVKAIADYHSADLSVTCDKAQASGLDIKIRFPAD